MENKRQSWPSRRRGGWQSVAEGRVGPEARALWTRLPVTRPTLTPPRPPKSVGCPDQGRQEKPEPASGHETPKVRRPPPPLTPARALRLFPAQPAAPSRACATLAPPSHPRTPRLFPRAARGPAHRPAVRTRAAYCLPGVVVSVRRAQQVQWLRSGAAAPQGRGGSEAATPGVEGAGSAVAGHQRGARGSGSARARR